MIDRAVLLLTLEVVEMGAEVVVRYSGRKLFYYRFKEVNYKMDSFWSGYGTDVIYEEFCEIIDT